MSDDSELLRRFADEGSEEAFAQLVRQRIDFVYGIALRQLGGDAHLAQEVTQTVFLDLAGKARAIARRELLVSWLYTAVRLAAAQARRTQARWHHRQQEAHAMQELLSIDQAGKPDWRELRPVLDDAMHELNAQDRTVLLLRFFDDRSLAQVGAILGLAEDTARKRVERALEKLRQPLARRGIVSTASALGTALTAQALTSAPVGLATSVTTLAMAGAATGAGLGVGTLTFMSTVKSVIGPSAIAAVFATLLVLSISYQIQATQIRAETEAAAFRGNRTLAALQAGIANLRRGAAEVSPTPIAIPLAAAPNPDDELRTRLGALSQAINEGALASRVSWVKPTLNETLAAIGEALELSSAQMTSLQEIAERARQEITANAVRGATVTRRDVEPTLAIVTNDLPENRAAFDRMLGDFAQVLGPMRYGFFESLRGRQSVEDLFQESGLGVRRFNITVLAGANDESLYNVSQRASPGAKLAGQGLRGWPTPPPRDMVSVGGVGQSRTQTLSMLGYLAPLVPDDF